MARLKTSPQPFKLIPRGTRNSIKRPMSRPAKSAAVALLHAVHLRKDADRGRAWRRISLLHPQRSDSVTGDGQDEVGLSARFTTRMRERAGGVGSVYQSCQSIKDNYGWEGGWSCQAEVTAERRQGEGK